MAVKRLKKNCETLKLLATCDKRLRKPILEHVSDDTIATLCECAHNILRGVPKLNDSQQASLKRHKNICRLLNNREPSLNDKRVKLVQTGGCHITCTSGASYFRPAMAVAAKKVILVPPELVRAFQQKEHLKTGVLTKVKLTAGLRNGKDSIK